MHSLIIFASGRGSNARAIIDHFEQNGKAKVSLIVTNNGNAGVIDIAEQEQIPFLIVNNTTLNGSLLIDQLRSYEPSMIILAGFLKKIPDAMVTAFPNKIINIHPALLPKYGGKGMYGVHVHNAVIKAKEQESGITIHYVNEKYDDGATIIQARCTIDQSDDPSSLAQKIHKLEHFYYPRTIEFLLG